MMFASLSNAFSGGMLPSDFKLAGVGAVRTLFVIYGLVFTCMAGTRVLLFRHAAQRALKEGRAPWDAQREQLAWTVPTRVGLASALAAPARPANAPGLRRALPGLPYALMFLVGPLTARFRRRHAQA
jgi:hypothetical protein